MSKILTPTETITLTLDNQSGQLNIQCTTGLSFVKAAVILSQAITALAGRIQPDKPKTILPEPSLKP